MHPLPTQLNHFNKPRISPNTDCPAGRVLDLEIVARGKLPSSALPGPALIARQSPEWVVVRPLGTGVGLLEFEVQRGGLLSGAVPTLALPSRAAVEEAQRAQRALAGTHIYSPLQPPKWSRK